MGTKMNESAYQKMIDENLEWLNKQPRTLERDHIEMIVKESVKFYYNQPPIQSEGEGRELALHHLEVYAEHCSTTVQSGDDTDKETLKELIKAIRWIKSKQSDVVEEEGNNIITVSDNKCPVCGIPIDKILVICKDCGE